MDKRGFTLIELLAVVTIIALLSTLIIPNITDNIDKKKGEISEANMKILATATNMYIEKNSRIYAHTFESSGSTYCIPVQSLINDNVLETPFKDVNGEEIDYSKVIKAIYQDTYNSFEYSLVEKEECTEFVNYVNRPELDKNMIPVIYKNNKWVKADINTKWYNYNDKNWANIVYVKELKDINNPSSKNRFEYIDAQPGTEISESDILAHFVWIPRFKYQLFTNESQEIKIAFESTETQKSRGISQGQWLTHPAFTQDNQELSGIWIAKYESSNNETLTIKKNQAPWINIDYNKANEEATNISNKNNIYGINNKTHLIKNSEWSAVSYLTNSKYGINTKLETNLASTTGNTNSTTGNNTGIYDMSGLSKEYVITNENENDLGYSLSETNNWYSDTNSFINDENKYLVRGNTSIFNYENSKINSDNTSFRVALTNITINPDI
ncbi:MAG: prepilin-type N-terminal cleavage/methylation domain-containing protein [Bacilli bacterium]|nr:prepilin-type N-terminal cleavage/methylation domain-containing protein [Bacilli bacterium]